MTSDSDMAAFLDGNRLYGDDFTPSQIEEWFREEERGYFSLAKTANARPQDAGRYPYHAVNERHGFRHIRGRRFKLCIGLGVAAGNDVVPIASQVSRFFCIEPARDWWRTEIAKTPSSYVMPRADGRIELPDASADLAISLSVLHHIPNVTAVLTELCRVLEPGGYLMLREPITSMGDWRRPRVGLTKNERGLPLPWFNATMERLPLDPVSQQLCFFPPFRKALQRLGFGSAYKHPAFVSIDAAISTLMAFNVRYHRPSAWRKFAPSVLFGIYRKRH